MRNMNQLSSAQLYRHKQTLKYLLWCVECVAGMKLVHDYNRNPSPNPKNAPNPIT